MIKASDAIKPVQRPTFLVSAFVCLSTCALAAAHVLWLPRVTVDDAFISYRYARNLVEGHGLVFNIGERVEGYSNLLWVLLTAGGMKLGFEPIAWTRAMGAISFLGVIALAAWTTYRLTASHVAAAATGLLLAASTALCASSMSGLETGLFALFVMAATTAVACNRPVEASLLIGLAAITRPEGAGLCIIATVLLLFTPSPHARRSAFRLALPCVLIVAVLLAFRLCYYGQLLPNSVQAKSAVLPLLSTSDLIKWPGLIFNKPGLEYIAEFFLYAFGLFALLALIPIVKATSQAFVARFMAASVCMGLVVAVFNFGDWMSSFRLLTPYLSLLTILVVWGASLCLDWIRERGPAWIAPTRFAFVATVLFCAVGQFQFKQPPTAGSPDLELAGILKQSRQHDLLATTDVLGRLGYYAPNTRIIDMAGLTDAHIAHFGEPRPPFGRNDFAYVLACEPHFIMNNVRNAWRRHLNRTAFANCYWWVDRSAWTSPTASRGKPRFVFVRRGSTIEDEMRNDFPDARFRKPLELIDEVTQPAKRWRLASEGEHEM